MQQWEYCVLAPAPTGQVVITLTYFRSNGGERQTFRAEDYGDGAMNLWPKIIADLGMEGWELVGVNMDALYFKRPLGDQSTE